MSDLRERLQDLATEMPALHTPPNLEARVRRRQVGSIVVAVVAVFAALAIVRVGASALDLFETKPGGSPPGGSPPGLYPWAVEPTSRVEAPEAVVPLSSGEVLFTEWYGDRVNVLKPDGSVWTIAGTGVNGYNGDGQIATSATLDSPAGIARDNNGNILFVDNKNNCIRSIDTSGQISAIAGVCGEYGATGDGGAATDARLERPLSVAIDPSGGFFFTENDLGLLRHVDGHGTLTTVAGRGNISPTDIGPGGVPASSVGLSNTGYVLRAPDGTLYVSDMGLNVVIKIDPDGNATLVAGTGKAGDSGDGGPATRARLNFPAGLALGPDGTLYVAETAGNVVRAIGTDGRIRTVVGTGRPGDAGDGGPAVDARLSGPSGLGIDAVGNLYIADQGNDRVQRVNTDGVIETVVGS